MARSESQTMNAQTRTKLANAGIDNVKYLVAEQRNMDNRTEYVASVNFDSARHGVASWLAEPGAMGSLSFVSPNAQFATSFVVKDPTQLLDEAIGFGARAAGEEMGKLRTEVGLDLKQDVISALGGEVAFAFDGPMLPTPSWKLIVEVNDPAKLQAAIEKLVQAANTKLEQHGAAKIEMQSVQTEHHERRGIWTESHSGSNHMIKIGSGLLTEIHYTFVDGYLVMAPTEALLNRTISNRMSGISLTRSGRFTRLLPRDQRTNFSAMVYQNAGELLGLLARGSGSVAGATPEQQQQVEELAGKVEPMLVCAYGEPDRIEIASQGSAWSVLMNSFAGSLLSGPGQSRGTPAARKAYR
jgi:hypothetical protein